MSQFHVQRIWLEYIRPKQEVPVNKADVANYGPSNRDGCLQFTRPFPWWTEDESMPLFDTNDQNLFWDDLNFSNWADGNNTQGIREYEDFLPEIVECVINLYASKGWDFVSHSENTSHHLSDAEESTGRQILLAFRSNTA